MKDLGQIVHVIVDTTCIFKLKTFMTLSFNLLTSRINVFFFTLKLSSYQPSERTTNIYKNLYIINLKVAVDSRQLWPELYIDWLFIAWRRLATILDYRNRSYNKWKLKKVNILTPEYQFWHIHARLSNFIFHWIFFHFSMFLFLVVFFSLLIIAESWVTIWYGD